MKKKVSIDLRMPIEYCFGKSGFPEEMTMYCSIPEERKSLENWGLMNHPPRPWTLPLLSPSLSFFPSLSLFLPCIPLGFNTRPFLLWKRDEQEPIVWWVLRGWKPYGHKANVCMEMEKSQIEPESFKILRYLRLHAKMWEMVRMTLATYIEAEVVVLKEVPRH